MGYELGHKFWSQIGPPGMSTRRRRNKVVWTALFALNFVERVQMAFVIRHRSAPFGMVFDSTNPHFCRMTNERTKEFSDFQKGAPLHAPRGDRCALFPAGEGLLRMVRNSPDFGAPPPGYTLGRAASKNPR
jgi:hypothetical protein